MQPLQIDDSPFEAPEAEDVDAARALDAVFGENSTPDGEADPFEEIADLTLPSGGQVRFRPLAKVTTENVKYLRGALDGDGAGTIINQMISRGVELLVVGWDACDTEGRPLKLPREDLKAFGRLGHADGKALERHLGKHLRKLLGLGDARGK